MAFLHRKILEEPIHPCNIHDHCDPKYYTKLPPPQPLPLPPPLPVTSNESLSPALIFMFCVLAGSFTFICYVICASRYKTRQRNRDTTNDETHEEDYMNQDLGPVTLLHPIWLINTVGLDQSQIESIHVFKYKKDEKLIEGTDCSVCLSEFEEDESLRLLPKCSHAFHIPCIDTWLRSHKNCPLCRAPIIKNANDQTHEHVVNESNSVGSSSTSEERETSRAIVNDSETIDDHHVVEVENKRETIDLVDHQDEELVTMRRSFSNNQLVTSKKPSIMSKSDHKLIGSSSNAHIRHKVMKSSSFGHSIRKASSFTSKSRTLNQSY